MAKGNQPKESRRKSLFEKEEEVLAFWKKSNIFKKSLNKNPKSRIFSFYDGPPFITGLPHYGTLLPSIAKDVIPRYKTMKGYYVPRVWGWDVHGLPAENKVEAELGLKVKKDIEKLGIGKFISAIRKYVAKGSSQWRWYVDHIGRWADIDKPYRTDDLSYMESVIWAFKQLYEKGLIYKGHRVSLYCPRCATPLSKFEVTMDNENYKDVTDPAVTIAFKLKGERQTYLLAWTTTPWTLPANNGLAINPKIKYVTITDGKKRYILAEEALGRYPEFKKWRVIKTQAGRTLSGKSFEPLFKPIFKLNARKDFRIWSADFPTADEGTGIVHIAPGFGEDDFNLGQTKKLTIPLVLDEDGKFLKDLPYPWAGTYFKKADSKIMSALKEKGLLVKRGRITHSYPHCYRCSTPLYYIAQDSWFMKIDPIRKQMLETSKEINWAPSGFGANRFKHNLETAPDWSISRARYWGTPLPIWETEDGKERVVVGSVKELERLSGKKVKDLHRPGIDEVVITTPSGKKARRVKEVLDVWFESGSMPYAQDHYPFKNKKRFEDGFPADFIIEYSGQLRGWFYTLHALSNALYEKRAFTNVITTGVLMGTDGRKMSKNFGNYEDPKEHIQKYGADAIRLYFMASKLMAGEDPNFSEEELKEAYGVINILHNVHRYFSTYAELHDWKPTRLSSSKNILDQWILTRLEQFTKEYSEALETYDLPTSTRTIRPFVEDLSTWYVRRSRDRFVAGDKAALSTLYRVLFKFSKVTAPTIPFSTEHIYRGLRTSKDPASVHLCDYPKVNEKRISSGETLSVNMETVRSIASAVHTLRSKEGQPLRQKLAKVVVSGSRGIKSNRELVNLLKDEANVMEAKFDTRAGKNFVSTKVGEVTVSLDTKLTKALKDEGVLRDLMRELQDARKEKGLRVGQKATLTYQSSNKNLVELVKKHAKTIKERSHFSSLENKKPESSKKILGDKLEIEIGE